MDIQPLLISSYDKYFKLSQADNLRIVAKLIVFCAYLDDNRDNGNNSINVCNSGCHEVTYNKDNEKLLLTSYYFCCCFAVGLSTCLLVY